MRTAFFFFVLFSLSSLLEVNASTEKLFHHEIEKLNQEMQHELISGDTSHPGFQQSITKKIHQLLPKAEKIGGKKFRVLLNKNLKQTLRALSSYSKNQKSTLNMVYPNGLTGRQIVLEALNPETNHALVEIYQRHKALLSPSLSGVELKSQAMALTMNEISNDRRFDFLQLKPENNYVLQDQVFNFIADKCIPAMGEEDFFLILFGFNRCTTQKYRIDRWTVGAGYYNATSGYSYVTGLKIGKKDFYGVGARVKIGVSYAGGIGVFIGNGLMFNFDLEKSYGIYAGVTYINIKPK